MTFTLSYHAPSKERIQEIINDVLSSHVGEKATNDAIQNIRDEIVTAVKAEFRYTVESYTA